MRRHTSHLMLLFPILAGILWGSVGIFVRELTAFGMDNATILFARYVPATILMFIIVMHRDPHKLHMGVRNIWLYLVCGVVGVVALHVTYNIAVNSMTMSFAAVLQALAPVYVLFLAAPIFKERITRTKVICIFIAVIGCMMVSGMIGGSADFNWTGFGLFCGIAAGFCFCCYNIFSKMATKRGIDTLVFIFFGMIITLLILLPFTSFETIFRYLAQAPLRNSLFLLAPSMLNVAFPYLLFNCGLEKNEVGISSILTSASELMSATVFGFLFFSEQPTLLNVLGLGVTIAALTMITRTERTAKRVHAH